MEDTVFMTAKDVRDFIHSYSLSRRQFYESSSILTQLINELYQEASNFETIELDAYKVFGVTSLNELQQKVDEINNSQLLYFSNEYLSQSGTALAKNLGTDVVTNIFRGMEEYLKSDEIIGPVLNSLQNYTDEEVRQIATERLAELINAKENRTGTRSSRQIESKSTIKGLRPAVANLIKFIEDPSVTEAVTLTDAYRKHFSLLLNLSDVYKTGSSWTLKYDNDSVIDNLTGAIPLSYYPYYQLTEKQKTIAKDYTKGEGQKVWENFVDHLLSVAGMQGEDQAYKILGQLGPAPFIKEDLNGIKGILGEVQMLFIAIKLTKGKNVELIAAGPLRNKLQGNVELGTDVLLNGTLGIQVKNYSIHNSVYQLSKTGMTWNYLQSKFEDNLTSIEKFYAIYSYNLPTRKRKFQTEAFPEYDAFYENVLKSKTSSYHVATEAFFASNLDKFLTLSEAYDLIYTGADGEISKTGNYTNVFYFFGGKTLVPVSYILRLLAYRIELLLDELKHSDINALGAFFLTSSYKGPVWPNPESEWTDQSGSIKSKKGFHLPTASSHTIDEVLNGMLFNMRLNLKLEDLNLEGGGPIKFAK